MTTIQAFAGSSGAVRGFGELSRADVPFAGGKDPAVVAYLQELIPRARVGDS